MAISSPLDIPDLLAWYSAEAITGLADNDSMTGWADLSGNGNHATVTGGPPKYRTTLGPGGGPTVDVEFATFSPPAGLMGTGPGHVLAHFASPGFIEGGLLDFGTATDNNHFPYAGDIYDDFGSTVRRTVGGPVAASTWYRYAASSSPGAWASWLNGVAKYSTASNTVAWASPLKLGNGYGAFVTTLVLYGRVLTSTERADLDAWAAANPNGGLPPAPPNAPTGLTADPGVTTVDLAWTAPATGPAPTGYTVEVVGGALVDVGNVTAYIVTGLTAETAYDFEVAAYTSAGSSAPATVSATTLETPPPPPPGEWSAHLRVGTHEWDVSSGAAPAYGPTSDLRFGWTARQDDGWPTQHEPTILSFGVVVAAGTDFDDVDQGTTVHFTFTPDGYLDPLVEFGGTVRDLVARPVPAGMLYSMVAVDHLQKLREDYTTWGVLAPGTSGPTIWPYLVSDDRTEPDLPDPLAGDYVPNGGSSPLVEIELKGSTWDVLTGYLAAVPFRNGAPDPTQRVILTYQLDTDGELLAAQPFLGTWTPHGVADTAAVAGNLLPTASAEWSRPRIEPNTVDTDGSVVDRPHTGVDIVRTRTGDMYTEASSTWILWGLEGESQWATQLTVEADRDPASVGGWFTLPDAMRIMVECSGIDPRHTPDGSGIYAGMLAGASLVVRPGGSWAVGFQLRRTQPA